MTTLSPANRRSPIHDLLDARGAEWGVVAGCPIAVRFQADDVERAAMESLGICDLSALKKTGVKGRDAESWLAGREIDVPSAVFDSRPLRGGGLIVRFGADEFFLEDGHGISSAAQLESQLAAPAGQVFRVEHQEATVLVTGSRSLEVLSQTCGINFRETPPRRVVFTRVAGVSCGVFPDSLRDTPVYRIWVDPSYARYLWETLVEIAESLGGAGGGGVIGAGCIYSELLL